MIKKTDLVKTVIVFVIVTALLCGYSTSVKSSSVRLTAGVATVLGQ